jgi:hypothetical protein
MILDTIKYFFNRKLTDTSLLVLEAEIYTPAAFDPIRDAAKQRCRSRVA